MIISFVILHYKTADDTLECVESLLALEKNDHDEMHIVIVDNASHNGSLETLKEKYSCHSQITFLENRENLGFARGNNVGYQYARETLRSDFIAVLNNDIVVNSGDLISRVLRLYDADPFHVMGPDIVSSVDGGHQNPAAATSADRGVIARETHRYALLLALSKLGLYDRLKKKFGAKEADRKTAPKKQEKVYQCQLHGSFLIYSPRYIQREKYAFFPGTFLYCEEAILTQHCRQKGYTTVYDPDTVVSHKEDSSTSYMNSTSKAKREFVFANVVKSHKVYLKFLKNPSIWD